MKYSLHLILVCIALARAADTRHRRLTNNDEAALGEFPYMVSIQHLGRHACGGTLISDRHVLTAAHCVYNNVWKDFHQYLTILVGTVNFDDSRYGEVYSIQHIKYHPNYTKTGTSELTTNDIAVIRLEKPINMTQYAKPIGLPEPNKVYDRPGTPMYLSGFGRSTLRGLHSRVLKKLSTNLISRNDCQRQWPNRTITYNDLCTLNYSGFGACIGDSGSPLTDVDKTTVVGIFNELFDKGCGLGVSDIYVRVAEYLDFITSEVNRIRAPTSSSRNYFYNTIDQSNFRLN